MEVRGDYYLRLVQVVHHLGPDQNIPHPLLTQSNHVICPSQTGEEDGKQVQGKYIILQWGNSCRVLVKK